VRKLMKPNLGHGFCAAVLAAAVTSAPVEAQTTLPAEGLTHRPFEPHYNANSSVKRGLRNEIVNGYWSGYAATAAAPYSSASATWQIPNITYGGQAGASGFNDVSTWVGIGGYFDSTLIQLGTGGYVYSYGSPEYYAWYELIPAGTRAIPYIVKPGDNITASLKCTAACSPAQVQTWVLTMTDATAGWTSTVIQFGAGQ
jgi:Peptidase A4 family